MIFILKGYYIGNYLDTKILKKYDYYLNVLMNQLKFSDLVLIKIHLNILF